MVGPTTRYGRRRTAVLRGLGARRGRSERPQEEGCEKEKWTRRGKSHSSSGKCQKKGRRECLACAKIETMAGEGKHDFDASAPERWNLKEAKKGRQVEEGQVKHEDKAQERGGWSMEEWRRTKCRGRVKGEKGTGKACQEETMHEVEQEGASDENTRHE